MKSNIVIGLGSVSTFVGAWFWNKEWNYARDYNSELASVLQWVGFSQALTGIALIVTGLILKDQ